MGTLRGNASLHPKQIGQLEGTAHYYRMAAVMLFMERHMKGLKKIGVVKQDGEGFALWDDALFEAFAKLPFKPLIGFKFSNVRNYVSRSKTTSVVLGGSSKPNPTFAACSKTECDILFHLAIAVSDGLIFMSHPKSFQFTMDAIFSEPCKTVAAKSMKACFGVVQFLQGGMQSTPQEICLREKIPLSVLKEKTGRAVSDIRFE